MTSAQSEEPPSAFIEPTRVTITERPVKIPVALGQPLVPRGRDAIGRQLQKELKRVGCYAGELNGVWTTSTRRAMQAFMERVNAVLPIDQPDGILLALVQGHPDKVCGAPCPTGQGFNQTGQCLPKAIIARSGGTKVAATPRERGTPTITGWTTTSTEATALLAPTDAGPLVGSTPPTTAAPKPEPRRIAELRSQLHESRGASWAHKVFAQSGY